MRTLKNAAAVLVLLALSVGAPLVERGSVAEAAPSYDIFLFNTDDVLRARLTNSTFVAGTLVGTSTFGNDFSADITALLAPGVNTLDFFLDNTLFGYTYGIVVTQDDVAIHSAICGTRLVLGCNGNDSTLFTNRLVDTFQIVVQQNVPEPATMLLLGTSLIALTALGRRGRR